MKFSMGLKAMSVVIGALLVAGCGDGDTTTSSTPSRAQPSPSEVTTMQPSESAGQSPIGGQSPIAEQSPSEGKPSSASKPVKGEITVTGTVADGVESGCVILRADGEVYLLLGGDRSAFGDGARVTVRGRPNPDLLTTCQQGIPFQVIESRPE